MKICNKCQENKTLNEFHKCWRRKDGHKNTCKSCRNKTNKRVTKKYKNSKECSVCKKVKSLNKFYKDSSVSHGLRSECIPCSKLYTNRNSKEECIVCKKVFDKTDPSITCSRKCSKIRSKEIYRKNSKKWKEKNPTKYKLKSGKRRKSLKQATPKWVNISDLDGFYKEAKWLSENSVNNYHVDHIVPILNKNVCGLNVPANIQILCEKDNLNKSNKFDGTYENKNWKKKK